MAEKPSATEKPIAEACHSSDSIVLSWLLKRSHRPDALADHASGAINSLLGAVT
jgi:hypothetical protein